MTRQCPHSKHRPPLPLVWFTAILLAASLATGCAPWNASRRADSPPGKPMRSQFRSQPADKPHFFFDAKAREIEASLGVGGSSSETSAKAPSP